MSMPWRIFTIVTVVSFLVCVVFPHKVLAATLYVDSNLVGNCASNYSITNRTCSGSDGNAYVDVASGIGAAGAGDTIYIRAGTYTISSSINISFSSSSTTTIQGYASESPTIHKTTVSGPIFDLNSSNTKNILFKNLNLTSVQNPVITGWTNYSGNVWQATIPVAGLAGELRFNTNIGTQEGSIAALTGANEYFPSGGIIYVYSTSNPTTAYTSPGINIDDHFNAIGIGDPSQSAAGNLITVDNVIFDSFAHAGVKGTWRWLVKNSKFTNIGVTTNDHDIYPNGAQTSGNEMVFEYNYFGYAPGAGIHLYSSPSYAIIEYNVFNGLSGSNNGDWGILVGGSNHKIYNNTFYGYQHGITLYQGGSQNNIIENNIFSDNSYDLFVDSAGNTSFPTGNTFSTNYHGSNSSCSGCINYASYGGPDLSSLDATPPNVLSTSPWTNFTYTFTTTGATTLTFFDACDVGATPSTGVWYLDDISITPSGGGAEYVTNGGMEGTYVNGVAHNWTLIGSASTWSQSTSVVHSGLSAQKVNLSGSCGEKIQQGVSLAAGTYLLSGWAKRDLGTGTLPVYLSGVGNTSFTIGSLGPAFLGTLPYSSATDFKINSGGIDEALLIDAGINLGTDNEYGLDSNSTTWPLNTINQNLYGSGWDLGAFVYNNSTTPTPSQSTSTTTNNTFPASNTALPQNCSVLAPGTKAPWLYAAIGQDQHSILLYFTAADDPVDHYVLEYGSQSNNYPYGSTNIGEKGIRTYLVQLLSPNTTYYFRVRGGNGCATGPWSNELSAKTSGKLTDSTKKSLNTPTAIAETNITNSSSSGLETTSSKPIPTPIVTQQFMKRVITTNQKGIFSFFEKIILFIRHLFVR